MSCIQFESVQVVNWKKNKKVLCVFMTVLYIPIFSLHLDKITCKNTENVGIDILIATVNSNVSVSPIPQITVYMVILWQDISGMAV